MSEEMLRGIEEFADGTPDELARKLLEGQLVTAGKQDPVIGAILELCAIPEVIDAEIIGVLRGQFDDAATNNQLFNELKKYPFVELYEDGTCAYHDMLRSELLKRLHAERPDDIRRINEQLGPIYFERGRKRYKQDDFFGALTYYGRAISTEYSAVVRAYRGRGRTYIKLGQFADAVEDFSITTRIEPWNSENFFRRAAAYIELEQYEQAIADLTEAIRLEPGKYPKNYFARGTAHYRLNNFDQALADFDQAVALIEALPDKTDDPIVKRERDRLDEVLEGRGIVQLQLKQYEAARLDFDHARELYPTSSSHWFWSGLTHYYLEEYEVAVDRLTQAVALNPKDSLTVRWRGVVSTKRNNYVDAKADFQRAIGIDPNNPINYYWLGLAQFNLREYEAALAAFNRAIAFDPPIYPAYRWRGTLFYGLGEYERALDDFNQAVAGQPQHAKIYQERGSYIFLNAFHNLERAEEDFNTALSLERSLSGQANLLFWRAQVFIEQATFQAALDDLNQAIKQEPSRSRNLFWRGVVYDQLNQPYEAEQDWRETQRLVEVEEQQEKNIWQQNTRRAWLALARGTVSDARDYYLLAFRDEQHYFLHDLRYQLANLERLNRLYQQRGDFGAFIAWYSQQMETYIPSVLIH